MTSMNSTKSWLAMLGLIGLIHTCLGQDAPVAPDAKPAERPAESPSEQATDGQHKFKPMDQVIYDVKEDPISPASGSDLQRFRVTPLGEIRFLVSRGFGEYILVKVKDRSLDEVREELKQKLEADYYEKATVYLKVENSLQDQLKRREVFFYGEAKGKVEIPPDGKLMLSAALLQVGYSEWANLKKIHIHRLDPVTGERRTQYFNVHEILHPPKNKLHPKDFELQDEDRIQVEEKGFNFF